MNAAEGFLAFYFVSILALCAGWVINIIEILDSLGGPVDALFIARIVGLFVPPFGGVIGYF